MVPAARGVRRAAGSRARRSHRPARGGARASEAFCSTARPCCVEDYLRVRPETSRARRRLVRDGRLQVGPWYVLADELIPSGESLVRNLLAGAARRGAARRAIGRALLARRLRPSRRMARRSPREFGIALRRALARARRRAGHRRRPLPLVRAATDARCCCIICRRRATRRAWTFPPIAERLPAAWARLRDALVARAAHAARGRVRRRRSPRGPSRSLPPSRPDRASSSRGERADLAARRVSRGGRGRSRRWLPALRGELRWSYGYTWTLQGVHGTRARAQAAARRGGALARARGRAARRARRAACGARSPCRCSASAWRTLLRSQFHDSIGGCTSDAVARRVTARIDDAELMAREVARLSLDALSGNDPDLARDEPAETAPTLAALESGAAEARRRRRRRPDLVSARRARRPAGWRGPPRTGRPPARSRSQGPAGASRFRSWATRQAHERLDSARHYPDQDEVDVVRVALRAPELGGFGLASLAPVATGTAPLRGAVRAPVRGCSRTGSSRCRCDATDA